MKKKKELISLKGSERFWLANGKILKNLVDLEVALRGMDEDVFKKHVSFFQNDFRKWIKEALGDKKLARSLRFVKNREKMRQAIEWSLRDYDCSDLELRFMKEDFIKENKPGLKKVKKLLEKKDKKKLKKIKDKNEKAEALKYLLFSKLDIMHHNIKKEADAKEGEVMKFVRWELERLEKKLSFIKMGYEENFYHVFDRLNRLKGEMKNV